MGGYVKGGDPATFFPELWEWLVADVGVRTVLDVGCGEGHALQAFRDQFRRLSCVCCNVRGIDGIHQPDPDIVTHDYTQGPWPSKELVEAAAAGNPTAPFLPSYDLVWCCEFVEHVEERYVPNFLETFKLAPLVLMTHAGPGQRGYHHVNCQTFDYWRGAMAAIGYELDMDLTVEARGKASANEDPYNHFARSGVAFRRRNG